MAEKALLSLGDQSAAGSKGARCPLKQELQNINALLLSAGKPTGRMNFPVFPLSVFFQQVKLHLVVKDCEY